MRLLAWEVANPLGMTRMWGRIRTCLQGHVASPKRDGKGSTNPIGPCSLLLPYMPPRR
jgi:hypothetical protein